MHLTLSAATSYQISSYDQESSKAQAAAAVAAFLVPPRFVRRPLMKLSSVPHPGEHSKGRGISMAGCSNEDEELVF